MSIKQDLKTLKSAIESNCIIKSDKIQLSSGAYSNIYFNLKPVTFSRQHLKLICESIIELKYKHNIKAPCIAGPVSGALPIMSGLLAISPTTLSACPTRSAAKLHGTQSVIDNLQPHGTRVIVVDDVSSTGQSLDRSCHHLQNAGYTIQAIIVIVDRHRGAQYRLSKFNAPFYSLFVESDFNLIKPLRASALRVFEKNESNSDEIHNTKLNSTMSKLTTNITVI